MDIHEIVSIQQDFDIKHGWARRALDANEKVKVASSDIVGIVGEIGEFSNLIKKAALLSSDHAQVERYLKDNNHALKEEIIDTFIYLMRLAALFEVDIEEEYFKKLKFNEVRFKKFEK